MDTTRTVRIGARTSPTSPARVARVAEDLRAPPGRRDRAGAVHLGR
ncbi:hypothetical protein ACFC1R_21405 [Kitasatospora sp. NPDC056138]